MRRPMSNRTHHSYQLVHAAGSPQCVPYASHKDSLPLVSFPGAHHFTEDLHEDRRK